MLNRKRIEILSRHRVYPSIAFFAVLILLMTKLSFANSLDNIIATGKKTTQNSKRAQVKINRLANTTLDLVSEYESVLRQIEQTRDYNTSLEKHAVSQEEEMLSIVSQMETIDSTSRGVDPLMKEMIASLRTFIELDLPFRKEERLAKVEELEQIIARADVALAEKYRKIFKAYDSEVNYGSKFATYQAPINIDNVDVEVDFLSVGRILLVYLTLDGKQGGYYNAETGSFQPLEAKYIKSIKVGIKMARGHASRELISLPVPAAQGGN